MNFEYLVHILPDVATKPLAIVAYLCLIGGWLIWVLRRRRSKDFLKALEALQPADRPAFCKRAGYSYDDLAGMTQKGRLRTLTWRYLLLAFVATLAAILILTIVVIRRSNENRYMRVSTRHCSTTLV
jgi:hypothetical protein